jgi:hypothetical protein
LLTAKFIQEVEITDPETGGVVPVEIWKDPESGAMFGVDATWLDQVGTQVPSPFNPGTMLVLPEEAIHG